MTGAATAHHTRAARHPIPSPLPLHSPPVRILSACIGIFLFLAPLGAAASRAPFPDQNLESLGYRWMTAKGRGMYVQRISRRQLKAMTAVIRQRMLFGYAG